MDMTSPPQPGANDPFVLRVLLAKEHDSMREAERYGFKAAYTTAWLAAQDLIELHKGQRASALPTQSSKEVTHEETSNVRRSSAEEGEEEDLTARSVRQNTSLLSKPAGGSPPAGEIGGAA